MPPEGRPNSQIDLYEAATDSCERNVISVFYFRYHVFISMIYVFNKTWMPGESATFLHPSWIGLQASGVCLDMLMCEPDTNTVSQLEADNFLYSHLMLLARLEHTKAFPTSPCGPPATLGKDMSKDC